MRTFKYLSYSLLPNMQITFSCLWGAFKYRNSVMQYKLH